MYSPKIREDLIPKIYRAARKADVPMTVWVNQAIEEALSNREEDEDPETKENDSKSKKEEKGS
jgi:hypothetical protein